MNAKEMVRVAKANLRRVETLGRMKPSRQKSTGGKKSRGCNDTIDLQ